MTEDRDIMIKCLEDARDCWDEAFLDDPNGRRIGRESTTGIAMIALGLFMRGIDNEKSKRNE